MNKIGFLLLSALFVLSSLAQADANDPKTALSRELTVPFSWEILCTHDPEFCRNVKPKDEILPAKSISLMIFQRFRSTVFAIAQKYNVDPIVLMSVIVTEHSLNVKIDDIWQNILVQTPIAPNGKFLGIGFSYGFGQIYADATERAEKVVARTENRAIRPIVELTPRLMTMEGALTYAAAILREDIDIYAKAGYDISSDPGVQATLYNIGRPEERLKRTVSEGRVPQVNYFGWFVLYHWAEFYDVMLKNDNQLLLSPQVLDQAKVKKTDGNYLYPTFSLTKSVPLFMRPERCQSSWSNRSSGEAVGHERIARSQSGTGSFEILMQSIDCTGKEWSLVRMLNGEVGWVSHYDIEGSTKFDYLPRTCEPINQTASCATKIVDLDPRLKVLTQDPSKSAIDISLVSFDGHPPDAHGFRAECLDPSFRSNQEKENEQWLKQRQEFRSDRFAQDQLKDFIERREKARQDQVAAQKKAFAKYGFEIHFPTVAELRRIKFLIKDKKDQVTAALGLSDWDEVQNLIVDVSQSVDFLRGWTGDRFDIPCREPYESDMGTLVACALPSSSVIEDYFQRLKVADIITGSVPEDLIELRQKVSGSIREFSDQFYALARAQDNAAFEYYKQALVISRMSFADNLKMINKVCGPLFSRYPSVDANYKSYLLQVESVRSLPEFEKLRPIEFALTSVMTSCEAFEQYDLASVEAGKISPPIHFSFQTGQFSNERTLIKIRSEFLRNGKSTASNFVTLTQFRYMKVTSKMIEQALNYSIDNALKGGLQRAQEEFQRHLLFKTQSHNGCSYDPIGSAEIIAKVSQLPCVQMVQIPDEANLVARIALMSKKVVGVVGEGFADRFRVLLKPQCDFAAGK